MQPRRLLLVRHAEAAHGAVDADRPLTERGTRQAAAVGGWLTRAGLGPDHVVVSPARRAVQTWERAAARVGPDPSPVVDLRIYDNTVEALLAIVREAPDDVQTVAVVGHNPSIGLLASVLDGGGGSQAALRDLEAGFPTGTVAVFTLAVPFSEVAPGIATLVDVATPGA
ncbi:histidine phosphatase family protein [Blastococcus sp. CT_GayMR20]|uniref:SixA phosphatase family protein n=1 Tax=Blastococcus sp. CT_GayMR20 TaxID=2559609 RepID=UPI001074795A|nr:histidine phosphatase family protein [Blastococcus sp. CT_GayMR20]TFV88956.1 histidine phosphatase family protein [Blastococcus sp. CT_GayMR20]